MKDVAGKDVKGAMITVDYNKSTKLWMRVKKYNSYATPHENNYHAILAIPTRGLWDVAINIT
ncbi:MAG: hypothetical protein WA096_10435, partial [Smithella sp.]